MLKYIVRRLLSLVPVLLGVTIIAFLMLQMTPGDPAELLAGVDASKQDVEMVRHEFGLDKPLMTQYVDFLKGVATGSLISLKYEAPVMNVVGKKLFNTLILALASIFIAVLVGISAGVISATQNGSWLDHVSRIVSLLGVSMPVFWWGLLMILVFSVHLRLLPSSGMGGLSHLVMPSIVLGTASTAIIARMTRSSMLEVLRQDYITCARAKGLVERLVILRHALPNTFIVTVTVIGLQFGYMLAGAVVTETVFAWPGVGRLLVESILSRDFPVVQTILLIVACIFVLVNLLVDVLYAYLDPRIRVQQ